MPVENKIMTYRPLSRKTKTYKGPLELGRCCVIGSGTMLKSQYGIIIGDFTRIAYGIPANFYQSPANRSAYYDSSTQIVYLQLTVNQYGVIGSGTMLKSQYGIIIGDFTRIAYGCVIMDTNMHFIKDIETGRI